jgi:hypothetical protein
LALAVATGATGAAAGPTGTSIPFGGNGDAVNGTSGQPVGLTPTSLLVAAEGPDGVPGTIDDVTLFVAGVGSAPVATAVPTMYGAASSSRIQRLSATRATSVSAGVDGAFGTSDDALLVLDRLGSQNRVIPVPIGGFGDNQQFTPERLRSDLVVVPSFGSDLLADTADDEVVVVTTSIDPPTVQRFPAPYQRNSGRTRIIALSPTAFLLASDGPNKKASDADDVVYLFRDGGQGFARTDLAAPGLNRRSAGRPVRLSSRHGLVVSAGPDFLDSTADDEVLLLDAVDGTVAHVNVPFAMNGSGAQPTPLAPDVALVLTRGADGLAGTADDAVAVLAGLGSTNSVSTVVVGAAGDNNESRPAALDDATFALVTFGADGSVSTSDDAVTIVHGVGAAPLVQHVVVGSVAGGTTSTVVPVSPSALLVAGGGPDQLVGTSDDAVVVLSGIGGPLAIARVPIGGALDAMDEFRYVPQALGDGRAALLSSGADDTLGAGGDDAVRILDGLGVQRSLEVGRLVARFASAKGGRPSRVLVRAKLTLGDVAVLTREDLTVSVGNASQTLAAGSLQPTAKGRHLRYVDAAGAKGVLRALTFDTRTGLLTIDARGADADLASTSPGYVPVCVEIGAEFVPQSVAAKAGRNGFTFRRPARRR